MSTEDRERFKMRIEEQNGGFVAYLDGRLDTYSSENFSQRMNELADDASYLILDMSSLVYMSSAGLRALYNLNAQMGEKGSLILCDLHTNVDRMLDIVDVKSMFPIAANVEEAQQMVEQQSAG
jgi:anti-sigma B factor antagonist